MISDETEENQKISWEDYKKLDPQKKTEFAKFKRDIKNDTIVAMISSPEKPSYSGVHNCLPKQSFSWEMDISRDSLAAQLSHE